MTEITGLSVYNFWFDDWGGRDAAKALAAGLAEVIAEADIDVVAAEKGNFFCVAVDPEHYDKASGIALSYVSGASACNAKPH